MNWILNAMQLNRCTLFFIYNCCFWLWQCLCRLCNKKQSYELLLLVCPVLWILKNSLFRHIPKSFTKRLLEINLRPVWPHTHTHAHEQSSATLSTHIVTDSGQRSATKPVGKSWEWSITTVLNQSERSWEGEPLYRKHAEAHHRTGQPWRYGGGSRRFWDQLANLAKKLSGEGGGAQWRVIIRADRDFNHRWRGEAGRKRAEEGHTGDLQLISPSDAGRQGRSYYSIPTADDWLAKI